MEKIKIDFIHIGYHKTASSYLQLNYFKRIDQICVLNEDISILQKKLWFYNNFVKSSKENFNKELIIKKIKDALSISKNVNIRNPINCISDENLSGDIYTGNNSKLLMNRIHLIFGETKILIVLRNQIDWLLSAYGNFVLHKGKLSFKKWFNFYGELLCEKLTFSNLISEYINLFGQKNINVLTYENLFKINDGIKIFLKKNFLINTIPEEKTTKKINLGRSLFLNEAIAKLNNFMPSTYYARIFRQKLNNKKNNSEKQFVKNILIQNQFNFKKENEKICKLLNINLPNVYFE